MALKITRVDNGDSPNKEKVWIKATTAMNTKGYAIVDRTFDEDGKVSNEFRHIFILPEINLAKDQSLVIYTGKGTNEKKTYNNSNDEYYALYWGADHCVWNDKGGDTATLISFVVVNSLKVPAI
jgi:hypothetical protein